MPLVPATPEALERAGALLRKGGVVAFPTETVYGLGANAFDARAVARIFDIKRRPEFDPLIVHVLDAAMLERVARDVPAAARVLMERFWPGPLTLILRKDDALPELVTAGLETVAVRMPSHPVARGLLEAAGLPLAAPSANPFGYLSPTRAEHVVRMLGEAVDAIVNAGPAEHGVESTIVCLEPEPVLLRPGAIPVEEIVEAIGPLAPAPRDTASPLSPGRLPQHYAPATPVRLTRFERVPVRERAAAAAVALESLPEGYAHARALTRHGSLREAAAHLFAVLHELDTLGVERIDVEPVPEEGLGVAIMDRLRRAAAR
ncbi:MAG TPA: L-threonylcarbamoyladenylate synthase [Verrucomicrobiae bacterium]|nr:L-threonylcarbamoyladenylate synthase [Verrucomicrobiae bacterium]